MEVRWEESEEAQAVALQMEACREESGGAGQQAGIDFFFSAHEFVVGNRFKSWKVAES